MSYIETKRNKNERVILQGREREIEREREKERERKRDRDEERGEYLSRV